MCVPILLLDDRIAIVDDEDADLFNMSGWYFHGRYVIKKASANGGRKTIRLHCLVIERKLGRAVFPGLVVDHINGNTCDNRRANLREITQAENSRNKSKGRNNTAGYKGVYFSTDKNRGKPWRAEIHHESRRYFLGCFVTAEAAAVAYNEAARRLHGEYARLNDIPPGVCLL